MLGGKMIGVRQKSGRLLAPAGMLLGVLLVAGCVTPARMADRVADRVGALMAPHRPVMAWDHRPEAAGWTAATLAAVAAQDAALAKAVPQDIADWCPAYPDAPLADRRAFWAGLLSALARHESGWNPRAAGGGGRYVGLMQISPRSARNYGCTADSAAALKDGARNLECAVTMMGHQVARDGQVSGKAGNRGIGRDWTPLRHAEKRAGLQDWTRAQAYCTGERS